MESLFRTSILSSIDSALLRYPVVKTIIFGAGGHARVVSDLLSCTGASVFGFIDEAPTCDTLEGLPVLDARDPVWLTLADFRFVIAIGDNQVRASIFERLLSRGGFPLTAIHPKATVSNRASIGPGTVLMAGAIVNPGVRVGANVILKTCCSVDHDGIIGDHSHLCPGVHLAGTVLMTQALVNPGARIGMKSILNRCYSGNHGFMAAHPVHLRPDVRDRHPPPLQERYSPDGRGRRTCWGQDGGRAGGITNLGIHRGSKCSKALANWIARY